MDISRGRISCLVFALALAAAPVHATTLGGSNDAWFGLDSASYGSDAVAAREPYAVKNYDTAKTQLVDAIYQWLVDRPNRTDRFGNQGVDVAPPVGFDAYLPLIADPTNLPEPGSFSLVATALASLAALRTIRRGENPAARRRVIRPRSAPSRSR